MPNCIPSYITPTAPGKIPSEPRPAVGTVHDGVLVETMVGVVDSGRDLSRDG
jgi:hypothetical protein